MAGTEIRSSHFLLSMTISPANLFHFPITYFILLNHVCRKLINFFYSYCTHDLALPFSLSLTINRRGIEIKTYLSF